MSGQISVEHKGVKLTWKVDDDQLADRIVSLLVAHLTGQTRTTGWDKPRNKITDDLLRKTAELYLAAPDGHKHKAVREHFNVSQPAAGCYISRARDAGLIPPSTHHASKAGRGSAGGSNKGQPRVLVDDEKLIEAALIFDTTTNGSKYRAVAQHFNVSIPTASKYIRVARDAGLLPESDHPFSREGRARRNSA